MKKVLFPSSKQSAAPILVKILSVTERIREEAGAKVPIWAIMVAKATYLNIVDFPPMFGPVKTTIGEELLIKTSFLTKVDFLLASTGWTRPVA